MLCQHMQEAHEQHLEAVQQQWLAAKAAAQQRNDEATAAARARYVTVQNSHDIYALSICSCMHCLLLACCDNLYGFPFPFESSQ